MITSLPPTKRKDLKLLVRLAEVDSCPESKPRSSPAVVKAPLCAEGQTLQLEVLKLELLVYPLSSPHPNLASVWATDQIYPYRIWHKTGRPFECTHLFFLEVGHR